MKHHATRGRRFAMIAVGDISKWSKGAAGFRYPEPKNRAIKHPDAEPIPDLPLGKKIAINAQERPCCVAGIPEPKKPTQEGDGEGVLRTVGFSNKAAMVFASLVKRKSFL